MTNTETTTPTATKKRGPGWVGKAGYWAAIIVATQIPSLFRTAIAAGKASDHVCEMATKGHGMQTIVESMKGDRSFNYPKRWKPIAEAVLTHNLRSCPAVASAIQAQR